MGASTRSTPPSATRSWGGGPPQMNIAIGDVAMDDYEVTVARFNVFWSVRDRELAATRSAPICYPSGQVIACNRHPIRSLDDGAHCSTAACLVCERCTPHGLHRLVDGTRVLPMGRTPPADRGRAGIRERRSGGVRTDPGAGLLVGRGRALRLRSGPDARSTPRTNDHWARSSDPVPWAVRSGRLICSRPPEGVVRRSRRRTYGRLRLFLRQGGRCVQAGETRRLLR